MLNRNYSAVDLIRFHRFALENPKLKPIELVRAYSEKHPEKTAKEHLLNLAKAARILHEALPDEDIPEDSK